LDDDWLFLTLKIAEDSSSSMEGETPSFVEHMDLDVNLFRNPARKIDCNQLSNVSICRDVLLLPIRVFNAGYFTFLIVISIA
jgi:hypothetical protein